MNNTLHPTLVTAGLDRLGRLDPAIQNPRGYGIWVTRTSRVMTREKLKSLSCHEFCHQWIFSLRAAEPNAEAARAICSLVCAADICVLTRASPLGTTG